MLEPIAFLSYTTFDNAHDENAIAWFCERLSSEVRMQTGKSFPIFRDKKDIRWGQNWKARIGEGIDAATFLITILTPSYFQSMACREEHEAFKAREEQFGRNDLILPVYYVECDELGESVVCDSDPWFKDFSERQYEDWRNLRWEPSTSPTIGLAFERLARQIKQALKGAVPRPVSLAREGKPAEVTEEAVARRVPRKEVPTHIVDAMHRGDFATISEAIAAAQAGDRIIVRRGVYTEGFVLDKPLEIVGEGNPGDVVVEANGSNVVLFKANMGIMRNLTLRQMGVGKWHAVNIGQGRLVLEDCVITSQSLACVAIHDGADPQVRRNRIRDGQGSGVFVYENGLGTIEDNDIFGNAHAGVSIKEGSNPTVRRNRIHDGKKSGVFVHKNGLGTIEDNDIFGNAFAGMEIREGGNPTVRRNRIHDGELSGLYVYENGLGTIEDNDIFGNALVGVKVKEGGNPTVRRNRINRNSREAVSVSENGAGTFEDNDLRDNEGGAWDIGEGCNVKRARNQE